MLETDDVPIPFSHPQMQNLGITLELDLKGAKITCPAVGLYSSPVEYSTMGHIAWDLTSLAYQPKSRERLSRPAKHVTFALSQRRSMYPARVQKLDDDEDDRPLVGSDPSTISDEEDEDNKLLVQPPSARKRDSSAIRRVPTTLRRRNGPPVWQYPSATLEQDVSGTSLERSEEVSVSPFCFSVVARMFAPSVGTMMDGEHAFASSGGTAWRRQRRLRAFRRFVLWHSKMEIPAALHHTSRQRTSTTAAATQTMNFAPVPAPATYAATASVLSRKQPSSTYTDQMRPCRN